MQQQQQAQMNPQRPVTYMAAPQPSQHPPQSNRRIPTSVHALVMVMSFIGMVLSLVRVTWNFLSAVVAGPVFAVAFFWNLAELIVRSKSKWKTGIHPGAHVVVCLFLWLSALSLCDPNVKPMLVGSLVLALLLAPVEFILFVVACADTLALIGQQCSAAIASRPYSALPPQWW
ncbi:hypothetical protein H634G_09358 [Metarhizium anisopliae BRIP 53293]|uniref:Uncharacterized protein n=1 Tax=Metarhizium anisopliae BRIP 53293 TaxID=1291518 RepID=A0A0D9NRT4_METAN|nr:hypothetical protein H634G_09358 [Metarhizium anisopliae BRIP 53293]KJK91755.1 hypothetical protein H633G_04371 [Metarhizium anisopliae BRIP 53284]